MGKKKPESEKKPRVKVEPFTCEQRVVLKREEVEERSDRLTHLMGQVSEKEVAFAEERKRMRSELKQMDQDIRKLATEVRSKSTYRDVACERRYLYDEGKLREVRLDTGATIFERDLNPNEQPELPFEEPGDVDSEFGAAEG